MSNAQSNDSTLIAALKEIEHKFEVRIVYKSEWFEGFNSPQKLNKDTYAEALRRLFENTGFAFVEYNSTIYIIRANTVSKDLAYLIKINSILNEATTKDIISSFDKLSYFEASGVIVDGKTGEALVGISIIDEVSKIGVTSFIDGSYSLKLPIGNHVLNFSGVGFENVSQKITLNSNQIINVEMFEQSLLIDEVIISGSTLTEGLESNQTGKEVMKISTIKKIPAFMGEVDVIKSMASIPGVNTVGEGANGFNVRGGNTDQNLILFDGIPVFNSSHLFGFFSIFNPDVVNDFTLYKGGVPARFGGRGSSILEVNSRNGDMSRYQLSGSIGLISNKLTLEGPILKNKLSFLSSVRLAHPTWLFKYVPDDEIKNSKASFKDINLKIHGEITDYVRFSSSSYIGMDNFKFAMDTTYLWNAYGSSFSLNKATENISWDITGMYSNYENTIKGKMTYLEFDYSTSITIIGIKGGYQYYFNKNDFVDFGIEANYYNSNNGQLKPDSENSSINEYEVENDKAMENSVFASINKEVGDFSFIGGVRYSYFSNVGSAQEFLYANNSLPTKRNVIDSVRHDTGSFFGKHYGWEPRFSGKWQINNSSSVKIGYNRMRQYMQMISKSTSISPNDFWKLSDQYFQPLITDQVSVGYYKVFSLYSISSEVYYKYLQNLIENRNGKSTFLTNQLETSMVYAQGKSYGVETKIEKRGKLSGWLIYTYSKSLRKLYEVQGYEPGFNNGFYPSDFDRPHNMNVNLNYQLKRRVNVSANFVLISGRPITTPTSAYYINSQLIVDYNEKNNERISNYHRLDLSLTVDTNLKKDKWFEGSWAFSVYNIYGRKNPFSIYFDTVGQGKYPVAYQLSILGNAFPAISYNFRIK
ncbi:MAG: TonB-dependent receptor [Cyclobacteriaceae bacterium]|nr:TonB-dependent receptor [Cyclobacteriaceae bacterium]